MPQLPPQILKMLEHIVAQEKQEQRRLDNIHEEMRDAVADLDICLSRTGLSIMGVFAGAFATILNNRPHPKNEHDYLVSPANAVALADKFMLRWVAERGDNQPEFNKEHDEFLNELFQEIPEVKIG